MNLADELKTLEGKLAAAVQYHNTLANEIQISASTVTQLQGAVNAVRDLVTKDATEKATASTAV